MKLVAKCTITNGVKTYKKDDVFEVDNDFTEDLVPHSATYLEPLEEILEGSYDDVVIPENLEELSVKELVSICKKCGLLETKGKTKEELIDMIELKLFDEENK